MTPRRGRRVRARGSWCVASLVAAIVLAAVPGLAESPRHALWKITGDGGKHAYIQGSVHLLKPENYPLPRPIEAAFEAAEVLALEADLGAAQDPNQQMKLLARAMLSDGKTLRTELSDETWALAEKHAAKMKLELQAFNAFKPWYASMMLTVLKLQSLGFNPMDGLDWHFYRRAVERGMTVTGFETFDEQMALFDSISPAQQDELVQQTLKDFDTIVEQMDRIVAAWSTGNMADLEATLLVHFKDYPVIYKRFVIDRNHAWIPKIERMIGSGRVHMIVVGAGHLPGKEGVLALLKKKGYRLEQQ